MQANLIIEKIKCFCTNYKLDFLTFAEEICLSVGFFILLSVDKYYADYTSAIGCLNWSHKYSKLGIS